MTKLVKPIKKPLAYPPGKIRKLLTAHQGTHLASGQDDAWEESVDTAGSHFSLMRKAAGITKKELVFELGWSKTYIDGCLNGRKNNPVEQARKFCLLLRKHGRVDLVAATIVHIAGGDDFDGRVLTEVQTEALRVLAKAVKE